MNPYLKRTKGGIGETGIKSEKHTTKRLKGRVQPASGAMEGAKGDIVLDDFLIEAKSTVKESLSLKYDWLQKISGEALGQNKYPALTISFTTENGEPKHRGRWVVMKEQDFKTLIDKD